jgi:hypothetical protein
MHPMSGQRTDREWESPDAPLIGDFVRRNTRVTNRSLLGRIMSTERNEMKKVAIVIAVFVAAFIGVGGILPALAKVRDVGAMPSGFVGSYTFGVFLLTSLGMSAVSCAIRRSKAA